MNDLSIILLTILIIENLLLVICLITYLHRNCQKCQKVKEIDQVFNKFCSKCQNGKDKKTNGKKEVPIY